MDKYPEIKILDAKDEVGLNGLHCIGNFHSEIKYLLEDYNYFKIFIDEQISTLGLCKIGEVYHNFEVGGFTAVVCLAESHLSIHTWPEKNYITFDVFLSNFMRNNSSATEQIFAQTTLFFDAKIISQQSFSR